MEDYYSNKVSRRKLADRSPQQMKALFSINDLTDQSRKMSNYSTEYSNEKKFKLNKGLRTQLRKPKYHNTQKMRKHITLDSSTGKATSLANLRDTSLNS